MDRFELEEEIRALASQCNCAGYSGPCRFCAKMEKLERVADRMDAETDVVGAIVTWLSLNGHSQAADAVASGAWRPKTEKVAR